MQLGDANGPSALQVTKLCDLSSTDPADTVCSVSWSQRGTYLSVGTNKGDTQLWDAHKVKMIRNLGVSAGCSKGCVHMLQDLQMVACRVVRCAGAGVRAGGTPSAVCLKALPCTAQAVKLNGQQCKMLNSGFLLQGHRARVGTMSWSSHILSSGSRDRSILQRDVRAREDYVHKFTGHRSEVCWCV